MKKKDVFKKEINGFVTVEGDKLYCKGVIGTISEVWTRTMDNERMRYTSWKKREYLSALGDRRSGFSHVLAPFTVDLPVDSSHIDKIDPYGKPMPVKINASNETINSVWDICSRRSRGKLLEFDFKKKFNTKDVSVGVKYMYFKDYVNAKLTAGGCYVFELDVPCIHTSNTGVKSMAEVKLMFDIYIREDLRDDISKICGMFLDSFDKKSKGVDYDLFKRSLTSTYGQNK